MSKLISTKITQSSSPTSSSPLSSQSIWGLGDTVTLDLLSKQSFKGIWLNLAAGDGRYNNLLLSSADEVIVCDIDKNALNKLYDLTPKKYQRKLSLQICDITQGLPFPNNHFDGIFCTGALHLFNPSKLKKIFSEINYILKPNGTLIFDFATDIKRILPNKLTYFMKGEPNYTSSQANELHNQLLTNYNFQIYSSTVPPEQITTPERTYTFTCNFFFIIATKK